MSWGTYYKHEGYLSRIGKNEIPGKLEACREENDLLWSEITAYMASTPPACARPSASSSWSSLRLTVNMA